MSGRELEQALAGFIAGKLGLTEFHSRGFRRHIGGFSWETYSIELCWREGGRERSEGFVARRVPSAGLLPPYDVAHQWELHRAVERLPGVPVPRALWLDESGSATGRPMYVMELVAGEVPATWNAHRFFSSDREREEIGCQFVEIGAAIHAAPLDELPLERLRGSDDPAGTAEVDHWEAVYRRDRMAPVPALDWALAWLGRHRGDASGRLGLVHGDYRMGNFIVREGRIVAMLDWELAHIGDPVEDLANAALKLFRGRSGYASGMLPLESFIGEYERASGLPVPRESMRFWTVLGLVRSAVTFVTSARIFEERQTGDVRYAALAQQIHHLVKQVLAEIETEADDRAVA